MITSHPPTDEGSSGNLDVRWCVFFPVGKQPQDTLPLDLVGICRNITINLHGFFFLDSGRLRIDGLEETFNPNGPTVGKTCLKWNEVIATDGTLARLPGALATFSQNESLTHTQSLELVGAIRNTKLWANFKKPICQLERWLPRWRIGKETWVCIADSENKTCQISSKTSCCDIGKSLTNQQHAKFLSSCRPLLRQSAFGRQDLGDIVASLEVGLGFFLDAAKDPDGFLMLAPRLHGVTVQRC